MSGDTIATMTAEDVHAAPLEQVLDPDPAPLPAQPFPSPPPTCLAQKAGGGDWPATCDLDRGHYPKRLHESKRFYHLTGETWTEAECIPVAPQAATVDPPAA